MIFLRLLIIDTNQFCFFLFTLVSKRICDWTRAMELSSIGNNNVNKKHFKRNYYALKTAVLSFIILNLFVQSITSFTATT